jgi:HAD superfamily hydrolase (TIGR01509 family)
VKAVLVDLYDTLVWTDWRRFAARIGALLEVDVARLGGAFELTREGRGTGRYGSVRGDLAALINALELTADEAFLGRLEREVVSFLETGIHVYDDVRSALRAFRAAGARVAIVSNCDHATRPVLNRLGLADEVDAVILSCEVGSLKPSAAIYVESLARLGATPEQSVFIDDQAPYLDGARRLGIRTVQIARAVSYGEISQGGLHPVISDLGQLAHEFFAAAESSPAAAKSRGTMP